MPWTKTMWGGWCDGRLDMRWMDDHWGGTHERAAPALFSTRKAARVQYEEVRKVKLIDVTKKRRAR